MTQERQKEITIISVVTLYTLALVIAMRAITAPSLFISILLLIAGIFWIASVAATTVMVVNRVGTSITLAAVPSVAVAIAGGPSLASLLAGIILCIVLLVFQRRVDHEVAMRVRYTTSGVFGRTIKGVIMGVLIVVVLFLAPVWTKAFSQNGVQVPPQYMAVVLAPAEPLIANAIPGYQPGDSIDKIISARLNELIKETPGATTVPPGLLEQTRAELSKNLGVPLSGRETIPVVASNIINSYISALAKESGLTFAIISIVIAFFVLRGLVPLLAWPTLGMISVIIYFSIRIGLIAVYNTQVTIERYQL